jgi:ribosomal protein S13
MRFRVLKSESANIKGIERIKACYLLMSLAQGINEKVQRLITKQILVRRLNNYGWQTQSPMGFMKTLIVELNGGGVESDLDEELIGSVQRHYSIGCHEIKHHRKLKFRSLYRRIARAAER